MYKVCAHYQGTIILLEEFECEQEAKEFMLHPYYIIYDDGDDEIIYPDEMFIEDELPFFEPQMTDPAIIDLDELPF